MGSVSWQFKKFADASSKPWFGQPWKDKITAGFTNSASMNGDKHSTLHYMITLSMNQNPEVGWIKRSGSTVRIIVPTFHQQLVGSATPDPPDNGVPSSWIVGSIGSAERGRSQCRTACFGWEPACCRRIIKRQPAMTSTFWDFMNGFNAALQASPTDAINKGDRYAE